MWCFRPATEPHAWRQTFALLSLTVWTFVIGCYLIIHLLNLIPPLHDWNFVPPPAT